jgi:hypothetical protein
MNFIRRARENNTLRWSENGGGSMPEEAIHLVRPLIVLTGMSKLARCASLVQTTRAATCGVSLPSDLESESALLSCRLGHTRLLIKCLCPFTVFTRGLQQWTTGPRLCR